MQKYKEAVEILAYLGANNLLHNSGNDHAVIIFDNMFKNAKDCVRIAAKDLCNQEVTATPEYRNSLRSFLERENSSLKLLLHLYNKEYMERNPDSSIFTLIKESKAFKEGRVDVRVMNPGQLFIHGGNEVHFATADHHAYRLEIDVRNRKAECNFGDEITTQKLERIFDSACTPDFSYPINI